MEDGIVLQDGTDDVVGDRLGLSEGDGDGATLGEADGSMLGESLGTGQIPAVM
jgi:hypothetical protein